MSDKSIKSPSDTAAKGGKNAKADKDEKDEKHVKDAKAGAAEKKVGKPVPPRGPALLELAITLSQLGLIIVGAAIFAISLQAGADLITSALRAGAGVLVGGLTRWLTNWWVARGSLTAVASQMREAAKNQAETHGTLDVNA